MMATMGRSARTVVGAMQSKNAVRARSTSAATAATSASVQPPPAPMWRDNRVRPPPQMSNLAAGERCTSVFIRNAITQLKTPEAVNQTEMVLKALKAVDCPNRTSGPELCRPVHFLTELLHATSQKANLTDLYTPRDFRETRLVNVAKADCFVFVYDERALSVSGGVELGYWLAQKEAARERVYADGFASMQNSHAVVVLMNGMSTTLLKQLPDTTYIWLDADEEGGNEKGGGPDVADFPGLVRVPSHDELTVTFAEVLADLESANAASHQPIAS
mmetsp:Transcript_7684/g.22692  ORF Transcript_7684/g.22692 Transcript_7684/m.22692 type:complete len:275 (-) Transcript_7684:217-1041(-)